MMDILDRLRLKIQRIPAGSYHTCGDACTNTDCLLVGARQKIEELRDALACEMDDTRNACAALNREVERLQNLLRDVRHLVAFRDDGTPRPLWIEKKYLERLDAALASDKSEGSV